MQLLEVFLDHTAPVGMQRELTVLDRGGEYVIRDDFEDSGEEREGSHFYAFLHDVVPVDVLDQIERVGLEDGDYLGLQLRFVASVLDGLLDYSAPITVFTKLQQV